MNQLKLLTLALGLGLGINTLFFSATEATSEYTGCHQVKLQTADNINSCHMYNQWHAICEMDASVCEQSKV